MNKWAYSTYDELRWFGCLGSVPQGYYFGCDRWVSQEKNWLSLQHREGQHNKSLDDDSKVIPASLVTSVDNDLLASICTTELEIAADELEDQVLQQYSVAFAIFFELTMLAKEQNWFCSKNCEYLWWKVSIFIRKSNSRSLPTPLYHTHVWRWELYLTQSKVVVFD